MPSDDFRVRLRTSELAAAHRRIEEMQRQIRALKESIARLKGAKEERDALRSSAEYRVGRKLVMPFRKLLGVKGEPASGKAPAPSPAAKGASLSYNEWRLTQLPSAERLREMTGESLRWPSRPLLSVIMPVYDTPAMVLEEAIASVRAQVYGEWELIAIDDASPAAHIGPLLERLSTSDSRIKTATLGENSGIALASNVALSMARGDFILFLDHDDWLEPDALFETASRIVQFPDADFIYSDEDKIDELGYFQQPFFKPDWSPDALLSINYCCHLTAIRRSLVEEVGRLRPGLDGAQDYDLFLRVTERARRILHIPRVLYHWRISADSTAHHPARKPAALGHGLRALQDALRRRELEGTVEPGLAPASYRVKYSIRTVEKVSILIPGNWSPEILARCRDSLSSHTEWRSHEVKVLECEEESGAAALRNRGARESGGAWILFLDPDAEFTDPGWLSSMAEHVQRSEVGAVGINGVLLAKNDGKPWLELPAELKQEGGLVSMTRNFSAVWADCMLVRREVFEMLGGFDEKHFARAFYDIDLCLRMRERGYSIVRTPHTGIRQASRGYAIASPDLQALRERWGALLERDPFNNPNLILRAQTRDIDEQTDANRE